MQFDAYCNTLWVAIHTTRFNGIDSSQFIPLFVLVAICPFGPGCFVHFLCGRQLAAARDFLGWGVAKSNMYSTYHIVTLRATVPAYPICVPQWWSDTLSCSNTALSDFLLKKSCYAIVLHENLQKQANKKVLLTMKTTPHKNSTAKFTQHRHSVHPSGFPKIPGKSSHNLSIGRSMFTSSFNG